MPCLACQAECHWECFEPNEKMTPVNFGDYQLYVCCCSLEDGKLLDERIVVKTRAGKNAEDMKDPISTGRKRAALIKPIEVGMICEWAGLLKAGGGVEPIIGCNGNEALNIHHGPDKDVLNNAADTNLHRICAHCHNRWHAANDKFYGKRPDPGTPFLPLIPFICHPHDSESKATIEQIFENEMKWSGLNLKVDDYVRTTTTA